MNSLLKNIVCIKHVFKIYNHMYTTLSANNMYKLLSIPALDDNYMYLLINKLSQLAIAVDPVEPEGILNALEKEKVNLHSILTTHHHLDHCGGNQIMSEMFKDIQIYGGDERILNLTQEVNENDKLNIASFSVKCLFTPCHTNKHMCYYIECEGEKPICFTGDTLFVAGCGKFFEGTAQDMLTSLQKLSLLPKETLICCGHEYTIANLKFAVHIEPANSKAQEKLSWSIKMQNNNQPTVPSTIGDELSFNPFMRVCHPEIKKITGFSKPHEVMAKLRELKDDFKT